MTAENPKATYACVNLGEAFAPTEIIERALERKFLRMSSFFKAVLVTGVRQVGKTTMLKHLAAEQNRTYVSMDNTMARRYANNELKRLTKTVFL